MRANRGTLDTIDCIEYNNLRKGWPYWSAFYYVPAFGVGPIEGSATLFLDIDA